MRTRLCNTERSLHRLNRIRKGLANLICHHLTYTLQIIAKLRSVSLYADITKFTQKLIYNRVRLCEIDYFHYINYRLFDFQNIHLGTGGSLYEISSLKRLRKICS